jgi:hypothetical protein
VEGPVPVRATSPLIVAILLSLGPSGAGPKVAGNQRFLGVGMLRERAPREGLWESVLPASCASCRLSWRRSTRILDDDRFLAPFRSRPTARVGRPTIPIETYVRHEAPCVRRGGMSEPRLALAPSRRGPTRRRVFCLLIYIRSPARA